MWIEYVYLILVSAAGLVSFLFYMENQKLKTIPEKKNTLRVNEVEVGNLILNSLIADEIKGVSAPVCKEVKTGTLALGQESKLTANWVHNALKTKNILGKAFSVSVKLSSGWGFPKLAGEGELFAPTGSRQFMLPDGIFTLTVRATCSAPDFKVAAVITDNTGPANPAQDTDHSALVATGPHVGTVFLTPYGSAVRSIQGNELHVFFFASENFEVTNIVIYVRQL